MGWRGLSANRVAGGTVVMWNDKERKRIQRQMTISRVFEVRSDGCYENLCKKGGKGAGPSVKGS